MNDTTQQMKISDKEDERRQQLNLPLTKPLRYMKQNECGKYIAIPVSEYEIVDTYMPSRTVSLSLTLENGKKVRILSDFFAHMQYDEFEEDMRMFLED